MKSVGKIFHSTTLAFLGLALAVNCQAYPNDTDTPGGVTRLATFDSATGQTTFALSLLPQIEKPDTLASDVLILVDTSASQAGLYQADSISVVEQLLGSLNRDDRVRIAAVDLEIVPFTEGGSFVAPNSPEAAAALAQLKNRVPLGSTDMAGMLRGIPQAFGVSQSNRNFSVIYVGDGVSRAGLVHDRDFAGLVSGLTKQRITFSCYAIGPERDVDSVAAIANMTGGDVFLDSDAADAVSSGAIYLANIIHGQVFWPEQVEMPQSVTEVFPRQVPPLRFDRDTILIGTLQTRGIWNLKISGTLNDEAVVMEWPITPEQSNDDFSFLPKLIDVARDGSGLNLPLLGSGGLREAAHVMSVGSRTLSQLGTQALMLGNASSARELAEEALLNDSSNTAAGMLLNAAREGGVKFVPPVQEPLVLSGAPIQGQEQPPVQGAGQGTLQLIGPVGQDNEIQNLIRESAQESGELIRSEEDLIRVRTHRMRAQVHYELTRATEELRSDPASAVDRLKSVLDILDQTMDIDASARVELRSRLESALDRSRQKKLEFDAAEAQAQKSRGAALEHMAAMHAIETREEEISRHLNRFSSLMDEGNYDTAVAKMRIAYDLDPNAAETNAAYESAKIARSYHMQVELTRQREANFLAAMYETDFATIARSAQPPLAFPDADFWNEIKAKRMKYQSVRLSGNAIDEDILRQLDKPVEDFNFPEVPFAEVMVELKSRYDINVVLNENARNDALDEDTIVNFNISGIRLKNALRLMLAKYNATYIVRNEVLEVISKDSEDDPEFFVTNIYNVGDLVAPRQNFGGGMMGGMGGGGMGGGAFCIQDAAPTVETSVPSGKSRSATGTNWNEYFSENEIDPAVVRDLVRDLMESRRAGEVAGLIQAALRNNQSQPWMFEALALAMQVNGDSIEDVERAVMSATDFSNSLADSLIAANYLANNSMELRALQLLKDISAANESSPEPYVIGLRAATRISDLDGLRWATTGILSQAWPNHPSVFDQALLAAAEVQEKLEAAGRMDELTKFRSDLDNALHRDVIVEVAWTGDADLDLLVEEPGGTICSRQIPRSLAGGILMGDAWSKKSSNSGITREYYVLPRGFSGDYRAVVRRVSGKTTGDRATVTVYGHYNSDKQASDTRQLTVDEKGTLVLFSLADGRRVKSIEKQKLERITGEQLVANRALLAQQLATPVSGSLLSDYISSRNGSSGAGLADGRQQTPGAFPGGMRIPGAVGYQPVITQIPEGTFMTVNHATTSDRLYVLISVSPNFSQVSSVSTFNIAGNAQNATGLGGGGGGGGLGGIGGGGGGGLGGGGTF